MADYLKKAGVLDTLTLHLPHYAACCAGGG